MRLARPAAAVLGRGQQQLAERHVQEADGGAGGGGMRARAAEDVHGGEEVDGDPRRVRVTAGEYAPLRSSGSGWTGRERGGDGADGGRSEDVAG